MKVYVYKNLLFSLFVFFRLYSTLSSCKHDDIDHHLKGENGWQFKIYWSLILNYVCLWLHPSSLTSTFFPLWRNIVCTEPIKLTRQGSNGRGCGGLQGGKFWKVSFRKSTAVMTQEIVLLMVSPVACAFGHLLPGPYLYLRLTLMRTFLLPSPDYRVVMTYSGSVCKICQ